MNKLKEARNNAGLTQQAMADKLEIPKKTIEAWEAGQRNPPPYVERLVIKELERIEEENNKKNKSAEV